MKKAIRLEDIGVYSRVPNDLNELVDGKQIEVLEDRVFKKPIRFVKTQHGYAIQIGSKKIFNVSIKINSRKRGYVLLLDDEEN